MADPLSPDEFRIEHRSRDDGAVVVSVFGDVDLSTCPQLREALDRLAAQNRHAVLKLIGVEFMDSSGLNLLVQVTRRSRRHGWAFTIRPELSDAVSRLFELTAMDGYLSFEDAARH
jgi:anti-anti-sigma factor